MAKRKSKSKPKAKRRSDKLTAKTQQEPARTRRIKSKPKSENIPPGYPIPKYILDESREETEVFSRLDIWRYSWIHNLAPAEVKKQCLSVSRQQSIWQPNDFGKACFKRAVKEILVSSGLYEYEDLKKLTTKEILVLMDSQLNRTGNEAYKKYITQWKKELREAYDIGLEHLDYWQDRVRESVNSVKQWYEEYFIKGEFTLRMPLPYMDDNSRLPDSEDLPWMYWILGMKLEYVFGITEIFVPEDVRNEMVSIVRHLDKPVWGIVYSKGSLEDFKTYWSHVKADLQDKKLSSDPDKPSTKDTETKLPPCHLFAYQSFKYAKETESSLNSATDREIYDWLSIPEKKEDENNPYCDKPMPKFETWERYLGHIRRCYKTQKNQSRKGRAHGSSIVDSSQINFKSSQQDD